MNDLKWLSNTYDPSRPDAYQYGPVRGLRQTRQEAYIEWTDWLKDKIIGEPKETESFSRQQLINMGMVGVYVKKENI